MIKYVDIYDKDKVNDECGVFGVYKDSSDDFNIASLTREALYGLQHRGQVSAGITVNNNENFTTVKEFGMVSEVLGEKALEKLGDGNIAIGHVRYSAHESLDRAANQPLVMRYIVRLQLRATVRLLILPKFVNSLSMAAQFSSQTQMLRLCLM